MSQDHQQNNSLPPPAPTGARTTDPVCGMTVDRTEAAGTHRHAGTTYAFSNRDCRLAAGARVPQVVRGRHTRRSFRARAA
jgi:YHS domain-containing protein